MVATLSEVAAHVTLKPKFPLELANKLWRWLDSPRKFNFDDFGPATFGDFIPQLTRRVRTERTWAILHDGEIVGFLGFAPQNPVAGQFHGLVIDPNYRGRGIGTAAFIAATAELKAEGFKSFLVMPFSDNGPILGVLNAAGYHQRGFLWNTTQRDGQMIDLRIMQYQEGA